MNDNTGNREQLSTLWQGVLEGNTIAFSNIHNNLFEGLFNYALKVVEDGDLANDAIQELFIRIWTRRTTIGHLEKVKEYFFSSLRRQLLNELRNLQLRQLKIKAITSPNIDFSPEEILIKNEEQSIEKEKILQLLNELPTRQKEVIFLHYFQNLDYSDIAKIMDINYQSVLNLTQKALQKLRAAYFVFLSCIGFSNFFKIFSK